MHTCSHHITLTIRSSCHLRFNFKLNQAAGTPLLSSFYYTNDNAFYCFLLSSRNFSFSFLYSALFSSLCSSISSYFSILIYQEPTVTVEAKIQKLQSLSPRKRHKREQKSSPETLHFEANNKFHCRPRSKTCVTVFGIYRKIWGWAAVKRQYFTPPWPRVSKKKTLKRIFERR